MNPNAVRNNKHINYLNQLEQLLPKEINKLSSNMVKIFKKRIPKIKDLKQPLPDEFNVNGSIVIRNYYFSTIINRLNHLIEALYNKRNYAQIKDSIRFMMTSINHANKHVIANQNGKLLLLRILKELKTSTHYSNLHQTVNIIVHLISQCCVLNQEAFNDYHFLIQRFKKMHNSME